MVFVELCVFHFRQRKFILQFLSSRHWIMSIYLNRTYIKHPYDMVRDEDKRRRSDHRGRPHEPPLHLTHLINSYLSPTCTSPIRQRRRFPVIPTHPPCNHQPFFLIPLKSVRTFPLTTSANARTKTIHGQTKPTDPVTSDRLLSLRFPCTVIHPQAVLSLNVDDAWSV